VENPVDFSVENFKILFHSFSTGKTLLVTPKKARRGKEKLRFPHFPQPLLLQLLPIY
jgi:hypothetical protein